MHCKEFDVSAAEHYGIENDAVIMGAMAKRYMSEHPIRPFTYRVSSANGLKRDLDYRYHMEMTSIFPDMESGEYIYAYGKLWSEVETELPFRLSCYGPVTIFLNGKQAYQANIEEEVFPQRRSWFRLKLDAGWNHFVWQFMRTGTGCGAVFGSGSIKGFPLHFIVPFGENEGAEGILYTSPIGERREQYGNVDILTGDASLNWHPVMQWTDEQRQQTLGERLFGIERNNRLEARETSNASNATNPNAYLAWSSIVAEQSGFVELQASFGGKLGLLCNGQEIELVHAQDKNDSKLYRATLELKQGANDVMFWLSQQDGADLQIVSLSPSNAELQAPIKVEGYHGEFLYSGPYAEPLSLSDSIELQRLEKLHPTSNGASYWRADLPHGYVRPFAEQTNFARWNYPLGVTLYGMLRLEQEVASNYALEHIQACTAFNEYAFWDAELFGAPGVNHQLVGMDSLDDCGSFASTMLYGHSLRPLSGAEELADMVAHYISKKQSRLEDGTLYRIKGSTDFMMDTMWCDDLYMSVPFLVRYSVLTGDEAYMNDAIHQLLQYKKYLFEPKLNIMHHVYDLKFNRQNGAFWGRGNGWVLFSLAELLRHLSKQHEQYEQLLDMYSVLSSGYLALQGDNGLWHQVLDDHESYEESSCTSMFAYAFAVGVQNNWFQDPSEYISSVNRAWDGLKQRAIDAEGNVYGVCRGSGFAHHSHYYKHDLMPRLNDTHGIGIIMLAGIEAVKMNEWLSNTVVSS